MSYIHSSGHWNSPSAIFSSHSCIIIINIIIIIVIIIITWGVSWSMVQPTLCAVPRISLTTPVKLTELERGRMILPRGAHAQVRAGMGTRGPLPRGRGGHCHAPHGGPRAVPGGVEDVLDGDVAVVFDVLHLLAVAVRLLQRLDDQGRGRGAHGDLATVNIFYSSTNIFLSLFLPHLRLPVLHGELDGDLEPLPVAGGLHDVLADLLGGEAEGSDLGGEGAGGAHLAAHHAELDDLDLVRVKLGRHAEAEAEAEAEIDLKRGTVFRKQKTTFNHEGPKT